MIKRRLFEENILAKDLWTRYKNNNNNNNTIRLFRVANKVMTIITLIQSNVQRLVTGEKQRYKLDKTKKFEIVQSW